MQLSLGLIQAEEAELLPRQVMEHTLAEFDIHVEILKSPRGEKKIPT